MSVSITRYKNFVGGEWVDAASGETMEVLNPSTGEVIAEVPRAGAEDVERAVAAAGKAFATWSEKTPKDRMELLLKLADAIDDNADELTQLESRNVGKPMAIAGDEMPFSADNLRFFAGAARTLEGKAAGEYVEGYTSIIRREPLGIVAGITPWNYPLMMAVWKLGPALAAGNVQILKPAEQTPLTTLRFAELAQEFLPPGVLQVITGDGVPAGDALVRHDEIRLISLTGSVETGRLIAAGAAQSNLKRVHLELGGKAPMVVLDDADPATVAEAIKIGGYWNSGQDCTASSRILVHKKIYDDVMSETVKALEAMKVADPAEGEDVDMGPVISREQQERVLGFLERAVGAKATVVTGGEAIGDRGFFVKPTVVADVKQDSEIVQNEVFGPVVTVQSFGSDDEAVEMANGVRYGLAASVFSQDVGRAMAAARRLEFGTVWVNEHLFPLASEMPHGGFKESGYGKDMSLYSMEEYTRIKHVAVKLGVTTADTTLQPGGAEPATLKPNAIGFLDSLVIGLASTAPAYSLAAIIGSLVVVVGVQAPGALLASFVPMFLIAGAFFYMNRADRDAGTTFSWVTRTLGPWVGWMGGWAVCMTGILVIGSLADVGARYTYLLFGWDSAAGSKAAVMALAIAYIVVLTWVCVLGTELSARLQNVMILAQVGALLLFAGVALAKVWGDDAGPQAIDPSWSWFSPFAIDDRSALIAALLIGVFAYWGWESAVNLCEETTNSRLVPGISALTSTVILLVTYVSVAVAVVAFAGAAQLTEFDDDEGIFGVLALDVLGSPWDKLVLLAIVTSAVASTQTTIIPASRTALSMGRSGAFPSLFARIHPRFRTPHVSTAVVAFLAIVWYVPANAISENFLFDSLSALALMIAFYYALSGAACIVYYRRELTKSIWNFVVIGVGPAIGALMLGYLFIEATRSLADTGESYSGQEILGLAPPIAIGYGFLLLGLILMVVWRVAGGSERYFNRRPFEKVDPAVASGAVHVADDPVA